MRERHWTSVGFAVLLILSAAPDAFAATTERVSVSSTGDEGNGENNFPSISADGRFVTFYSPSSNLVPDDTNNELDTFLFDRQTDTMERVSVNSSGEQGNSVSGVSSISADGRFVAFNSFASNLVPDDTNGSNTNCGGCIDVFVRDRLNGTTERVSVDSNGVEGIGHSLNPSISADGRYVAFWSQAPTLVSGDTNGTADIFVHDRQTGTTERVSVTSSGVQGNHESNRPSISPDGRYVVFDSLASNLVANDTNFADDVFIHDRQTGTTERVSLDSSGTEANAPSLLNQVTPHAVSADGRYVTFYSFASNLVPGDSGIFGSIFVRDRQSGTTQLVSVDSNGVKADDYSYDPAISLDGRYVTYYTNATNLVTGDTNEQSDVFRYDLQTGVTERISVNSAGAEADGGSFFAAMNDNGNIVAFASYAPDLVPDDTNSQFDVFVREFALSSTPSFTLSPSTLTFAVQAIGVTSSAQPVTFTNTSVVAVPITSITRTGGTPGQFAHTHNCGTSVASGATCTINVTFRPTSAGTKVTTLNVNAGGGAGTKTTALSGSGAAATYTLTPPTETLDFGDQALNVASASRAITLANTGSVALPITNISTTGTNANQFNETHNCGSSVPVGGSCSIDAVFRPTTTGAKLASVRVAAGGGGGIQTIGVSGNGIAPTYTLNPTSLAFPNQAVTVTSAALAITLTNTSALALPITGITRTGTNANQFALTHDCGASVTAGSACTINVTFRPTTAGAKVASVRVNAGAGAGVQTASLNGTGVVPTYSVSPPALGFGTQLRNTSSAPQTVTVTNTGSVQLPITSITANGANAGQFLRTNNCVSPIGVGQSCTVDVVFRPTSAGAKSANLNVNAGGGAGTQAVPLSGTGT